MPSQIYYVYLLTNWNHRVLYIGVTNDLSRRLYEHKNKLVKGFTEKYNVNKLVYFEETNDVRSALSRKRKSRNGDERRRMPWCLLRIQNGEISQRRGKISRFARNDTSFRFAPQTIAVNQLMSSVISTVERNLSSLLFFTQRQTKILYVYLLSNWRMKGRISRFARNDSRTPINSPHNSGSVSFRPEGRKLSESSNPLKLDESF